MYRKKFFLITILKKLEYIVLDLLQALSILVFLIIFRFVSFEQSSKIAGFVGKKLGMILPCRKRAYQSLKLAMPELSESEQNNIVANMFGNLSSTIVEFGYLNKIKIKGSDSQVEIKGLDILEQLKQDGKAAILFSAHLSAWELGAYVAVEHGLDTVQFYRKLNYYLTNKLITWRHLKFAPYLIAKGTRGAREMVNALKSGKHVSLLTDQKFNPGEIIPFFGIPAKTPSGGAQLALKYNFPFVPVRVEKIADSKFRVTYYPPLQSQKKDPKDKLIDLMTQMNQIIEDWIRERPEQWLWLHRRWPHRNESVKE